MNAMLIVKTVNGYAAMPYSGEVPADAMSNLRIATRIDKTYSSGAVSLLDVMEDYFEPEPAPEISALKVA
jgi:hypothetical protein